MGSLLDATLYPSIRSAVDLTLDEIALPDSIIELPIYGPAAELEVLARDSIAAERSGTELTHALNAVVYLTAARLVLALPQLTSETLGDYAYNLKGEKPEDRAAQLRGLAEGELAAYLNPGKSTVAKPRFFDKGTGGRY